MKATEILMDEHRVIERVITALETAAHRLSTGQPVSPAFFLSAADFIKGFADGCHHKKEEGVLFPAMIAGGLPPQSGPVAVMLAEHEEGRRLTRAMREGAERLQTGEKTAAAQVIQSATGYAALLRQHIAKEDRVLFPMADNVIPQEQHQRISEAFDHIEHEETGAGLHEKYLGLAEQLEKAISA